MRKLRPHRLAVLVLALLTVAATMAGATANRVVEQNEDRLLAERFTEVASLLESLGSGYEAEIAAVASVADVTGGDPAEFRRSVLGVDGGAESAGNGGWSLLRRIDGQWVPVSTLGAATAPTDLPPEVVAGLDTAAEGGFTVLGFFGSGFDRRFAMASGRPGSAGDLVVVTESGLFSATADATSDDNPIAGLAARVYVGDAPVEEKLLLALGPIDPERRVGRAVDVAGAEVFLEVSPTEPLAGGLALSLPRILFFGLIVVGLSLAGVVEVIQRRRDDAVRLVADLEVQNARLDQALHDQREAEAARASMEAELRQSQRLEAVGHLAGGVAHDFNNVLAAILSYADLATDAATDPDQRTDLEAIQHAARRGADLTRKLLQFSRRRPGEATVVDVNDRVADLTSMLGRTLGEDVTLATALADGPALAVVDPVELDQVLLNLVVNARDAVGPGGVITIATGRVAAADLADDALAHDLSGGAIRVAVTDDGAGMDPEVLEHAFEPFFTTKGRGEGTGLGLSTVYGIVQRSGGRVAAISEPGIGTTIEVLLPMAEETELAIDVADVAPAANEGGGRTVLVVEDEPDLRLALCRMLEGAGFRVLDAPDGPTALEAHCSAALDLLVTDVIMPKGVTGVDVAAGFRARQEDLPVLFVTGYSDDILDPDTIDGAHTVLLQKPFSAAELLEAVDAALGVAT